MDYIVNENIIESVFHRYNDDKITIDLGKDRNSIEMEVTSEIKEGCTCSTTLFKLITYKIIEELDKKGRGFRDLKFNIAVLFFADDGIILSPSVEHTKHNIISLVKISQDKG